MTPELLDYMHFGWFVVPIHGVLVDRETGERLCSCIKRGACTSPAKHPTTPHGLKNATTNRDWIAAWWKKWPFANVGIVTGALSGLVVLDIDPRHGGDDSLDELLVRFGKLPDTVEAATGGGGRHLYFRHPGFPVANSAGRLGRGLDIRGDGGYVLAPPSEHISGGRYEWEASSEPSMAPLAALPKWLLERLTQPAPRTEVPVSPGAPGASSIIGEGGRDNFLTACGGAMRRWGMTHDAILAALRIDNEKRCRPPLPDEDIQRIAKSVMRYAQVKGVG